MACDDAITTLICYNNDPVTGCRVPCEGSSYWWALFFTVWIIISILFCLGKMLKFLGLKGSFLIILLSSGFSALALQMEWIKVCETCSFKSYYVAVGFIVLSSLIGAAFIKKWWTDRDNSSGGGASFNNDSYARQRDEEDQQRNEQRNWDHYQQRQRDQQKIDQDRERIHKENMERIRRNEAEYRRQKEIAAREKYYQDMEAQRKMQNRARGW